MGSDITRRDLLKTSIKIGGGIVAGKLAGANAWAAPLVGKKIEIKLRQDQIADSWMNYMLQSFNAGEKDIVAQSSFLANEYDFGYEKEHSLEVLPWHTQGEPCQVYLGRGFALSQLADAGLIIPLDDLLRDSDQLDRDDFHSSRYGSVLDTCTYRGKLWGIPLIASTYALFCNTDLFKMAGIGKYPTTWDEAIEDTKAINRDTDGDGVLDIFGYSQCSFQFPIQILSAGIDTVDLEKKRSTFDTEAAVDALETFLQLKAYQKHIDFERGDMGMKLSVTTNAMQRYKHLNFVTVTVPSGARRANQYGDSDGALALAVSSAADPDQVRAAWRLIEFMVSEKAFHLMAQMSNFLPLRKSILHGERYQAFVNSFPQMRAFVDDMEFAIPAPCIPEYRFISAAMREILIPFQTGDMLAVTRDQMRAVLLSHAERINEVLSNSAW